LGITLISLRASDIPHTIEKTLDEGYNFVLDLISIEGLHTKLWDSKIKAVPILGMTRSQVLS
jgi:hypothetical protein